MCFTVLSILLITICIFGIIKSEKEVNLSGFLTFDLTGGGIFIYDICNNIIQEVEVVGYEELSNITKYVSTNNSFYCTGVHNEEYYLIEVINNSVVHSWKLPQKPVGISVFNENAIIVLDDKVVLLNKKTREIRDILKDSGINCCIAYENSFVLWGDETYYICNLYNDDIIIGDSQLHDSSLRPLCMINAESLLMAKMSYCKLYNLNLTTNMITDTNYDIGETYPKIALGNNVICLYESNYEYQCKFWVYQIDKNKLGALDLPDDLLSAINLEWVNCE